VQNRLSKLHPSPYLLLSLSSLFWSGNWVVGRALRDTVPPIALSFWRWLLATLILLPFAYPHLKSGWPEIRRSWKILVLLGVCGTAVFNAFGYVGVHYTTATNGVLLQSFAPVMIVALSRIWFHERLHTQQVIGLLLSLTGVACIMARGDPALLAGLRFNIGDALVVGSLFGWALYTIALRNRPAGLHALALLSVLAFVGVAALAPVYAWELVAGAHIQLSAGAVAGLGYVALFPSVLAYVFWNRGVREVGANKAGLFLHLMPVFGSLLSIVFLGERLYLYHLIGMLLIFAGIYLTSSVRTAAQTP
jgi:drug/metabolite transporter (DMT)-like permease